MSNRRAPSGSQLSASLIVLLAFACGAMVANLYYAQTLIEAIGPEIGLSAGLAGAIVTLTQLGYGIGLFLIVPLGDLFENRRLILVMIGGTFLGCLGIALSEGPATFLTASLITGTCATGAQILLPLATHLAPPERQGQVIGQFHGGDVRLALGFLLLRGIDGADRDRARLYAAKAATVHAQQLPRDPRLDDLVNAKTSSAAFARVLSGSALRGL
jgi:MFS family permease